MNRNLIDQKYTELFQLIKSRTKPKNKVNQFARLHYGDYRIEVFWDFHFLDHIKKIYFQLPKNISFEIEILDNGKFSITKYSENQYPHLALCDDIYNANNEAFEYINNLIDCFENIISNKYSIEFYSEDFLSEEALKAE